MFCPLIVVCVDVCVGFYLALFCFAVISLGITLLELASDLELPKGGQAWHQLRNGELPNIFTQGLFIH